MKKQNMLGMEMNHWRTLAGIADPYPLPVIGESRDDVSGGGYAVDREALWEVFLEERGTSVAEYNQLARIALEEGDDELIEALLEMEDQLDEILGGIGRAAGWATGKVAKGAWNLGKGFVQGVGSGAGITKKPAASATGQAAPSAAPASAPPAAPAAPAASASSPAAPAPAPAPAAPAPAAAPAAPAAAGAAPAAQPKKPGLLGRIAKGVGGAIGGAVKGAVQGYRGESIEVLELYLGEEYGFTIDEYVDLYDEAYAIEDIETLEQLALLDEGFRDWLKGLFSRKSKSPDPLAKRTSSSPASILADPRKTSVAKQKAIDDYNKELALQQRSKEMLAASGTKAKQQPDRPRYKMSVPSPREYAFDVSDLPKPSKQAASPANEPAAPPAKKPAASPPPIPATAGATRRGRAAADSPPPPPSEFKFNDPSRPTEPRKRAMPGVLATQSGAKRDLAASRRSGEDTEAALQSIRNLSNPPGNPNIPPGEVAKGKSAWRGPKKEGIEDMIGALQEQLRYAGYTESYIQRRINFLLG